MKVGMRDFSPHPIAVCSENQQSPGWAILKRVAWKRLSTLNLCLCLSERCRLGSGKSLISCSILWGLVELGWIWGKCYASVRYSRLKWVRNWRAPRVQFSYSALWANCNSPSQRGPAYFTVISAFCQVPWKFFQSSVVNTAWFVNCYGKVFASKNITTRCSCQDLFVILIKKDSKLTGNYYKFRGRRVPS